MSPSPLDAVIEANLSQGSVAIAQALAASPHFLGAIEDGLARQKTGTYGASQAQLIRQEIVKAMQGD